MSKYLENKKDKLSKSKYGVGFIEHDDYIFKCYRIDKKPTIEVYAEIDENRLPEPAIEKTFINYDAMFKFIGEL
jgi:hypothetical protein